VEGGTAQVEFADIGCGYGGLLGNAFQSPGFRIIVIGEAGILYITLDYLTMAVNLAVQNWSMTCLCCVCILLLTSSVCCCFSSGAVSAVPRQADLRAGDPR